MKKTYGKQGLQIISVHTPEFDYEKDRDRVVRAAKKFALTQPIFMDNDYAYWRSLGNRYWPTFYVVDSAGNIRLKSIGEMHKGQARAEKMETLLKKLLAKG